jgi:AcrR family transcriptional regulator
MQSQRSGSENAIDTRFRVKRDRMLRAAARCFNLKGYSGTSLKDVADLLGLTDAALYYYVRNKQELVYLCYVRAADVGRDAMQRASDEGEDGLETVRRYLRYHIEYMVGDQGPVAIMSEHSAAFEALLERGIADGSIAPCDVRMTGNAIMGSLNWIPKWFHGDPAVAEKILEEFPRILSAGLA